MKKISKEYIDEMLSMIQEKAPLIHCITNEITVNDVANIILAVGGSPTMAHHEKEVEEITSQSDCLLINLGATEYLNQIYISGSVKNVTKIFDPVGSAASIFRREEALKIIKEIKPNVIRGNYSEIFALYFNKKMARGVDREENNEIMNAVEVVSDFAVKTGSIVIASGARDIISDGNEIFFVDNGSEHMRKITGSGCMATGVISAFCAIKCDIKSAASAMIMMGICGENAERMVKMEHKGVYTFKSYFIDSISRFKDISDIEVRLSGK